MRSSKARLGLNILKCTVSLATLAAMTAMAAPAMAQDAPAAESADKEVVVVGVRKALKSAQQIKKDADTIVDSITASDIGSFPDKSVAEALQRVAGITVNRFAASDDTAHFSAEPSGVVVRGLQQVRSEFNGRDIFTADSNRGLSWSDVSPELMGGVDVYKNQTAELIEGGIAGSVNLRTRLPFDQKGRVLAATAEYTYGDLVKDGAGAFSGIYSDRWDTSLGEFGVMLNAAHSQVLTNSQGIQFGRYAAVVDPANLGGPTGGSGKWDDPAKRYLPGAASIRDNDYDRVRDGVAFAAQWQNHDHTMLATLQYNQSKKREQWEEHVMTMGSGTDSWAKTLTWVGDGVNGTRCLPANSCTFNDQGGLTSGTLVQSIDAWYGQVSPNTGATIPGQTFACYAWESCGSGGVRANGYETQSRYSDSTNDTKDLSFNFKWDVNDRLKLNFDVQHVDAIQKNYDITSALSTFATVKFDLTGDHPVFTVSNPNGFNTVPGANGALTVTNPANYHVPYFMDHLTDSDGTMDAVRLDMQYSFDSPWLNNLKAGVRFADRKQHVRWSTYNWQSAVNNWTNYDADNYFITGSAFPNQDDYGTFTLDENFYGGGVTNAPSGIFFDMDVIKDREGFATTYGRGSYQPMGGGTNNNNWLPVCYRGATEVDRCYRAAEVSLVEEKTKAVYAQLKFGGADATIFDGITVTGNIGVRYVETQNISTGGVNYSNPNIESGDPLHPGFSVPSAMQPVAVALPMYWLSQANKDFLKLNANVAEASITHRNWLPSANVRFGLTDQWFLRFAASRAMSRPDIGNLKAYASVGYDNPTLADQVCGKYYVCAGTAAPTYANQPTGTNPTFAGSAQNPYLKPVTADQVDMSIENYFSSTGSVTFNLFYKKFHDYIQFGTYYRDFTNGGTTNSVRMNGPQNGDGASIKGFELAYSSFFDFLPSPWDGLGVQANYTHLQNSGINGGAVKKETASDDGGADPIIGGIGRADNSFLRLPLEALSDDSYNLIGMYEKGPFSARVAYNWRSKFMVTAQDCCTTFPVWQKANGYLDARFAYRINENVEVSLEGSNLLSTETVLQQQVDGPTKSYPDREVRFLDSSWFKNDRRLQASVRLKY